MALERLIKSGTFAVSIVDLHQDIPLPCMHRQRILRFNIELMRGEDFTHECFNDMLLDIDEYERFCETHPGYKNNRAVMAIANIKRVYQDHEENGGFLV